MKNDLISRQAAIDALNVGAELLKRVLDDDADIVGAERAKYEWGLGLIESCISDMKEIPSAQPEPCGDVVSRNAIVQKLNEMDRYVSTELRLCDTDKKFPQNEVFIVDDVYEEIVEQLPSAQPTGTPLHDNGSDYAHGFADGRKQGLKDAESEKVRCKDCVYWVAHDKRCVYLNHGFAPNMWCCHGRRADD